MQNYSKPAASDLAIRRKRSDEIQQHKDRHLRISLEKRIEALTDLLADVRNGHGGDVNIAALVAIDSFLFDRPCTQAHIEKWTTGSIRLPVFVKRGLVLYQTMQKLISIYSPKCDYPGPGCGLIPPDRKRLKLLSPELQALEQKARHCFSSTLPNEPAPKPTLQGVAAKILAETNMRGYSHRNALRSIRAVKDYKFPDDDPQRDRMIQCVNAFGFAPHAPVNRVPAFQEILQDVTRLAAFAWLPMSDGALQEVIRDANLAAASAVRALVSEPLITKDAARAIGATVIATQRELALSLGRFLAESQDKTLDES